MTKGRQYAESIVGPLDRSFYDTQRNVSQKMYETNWENLQNQYKNLQEKLKKDQAEANRNFANGLVNVAENSYDRMTNTNESMALKGLTSSGLNNLVEQGDITTKGAEVLDLLEKSGDVSVSVAEDLNEMNKTATEKQNELANSLADTLGDIGASDTSAQMAYNKGLAGIAEDMEAREAENALAAAQRAASAAASGYNTDEEEAELDEFYRRKAITSLLQGINPETGEALDISDEQKAMSLKILYDIDNGKDIVDIFNKNITATQTYNDSLEKSKDPESYNDYKEDIILDSDASYLFLDSLVSTENEDGTRTYDEDESMRNSENKRILLSYLKGWKGYSEEDAEKALNNLINNGEIQYPMALQNVGFKTEKNILGIKRDDPKQVVKLSELKKLYKDYGGSNKTAMDYDNLIDSRVNEQMIENSGVQNGITYEELIELLYGSR